MKRVRLKPCGPQHYELLQDYEFAGVRVPAGYQTNGADVPRALWVLYPPNSPEYISAVVLHDYLCEQAVAARDYAGFVRADSVLLAAMRELSVRKSKCYAFYLACRSYHFIRYKLLKLY